MFFKLNSKVLFRNFDSFGYITDNRNFEYKNIIEDENYIGDKILSASGAVFVSVLTKLPQKHEVLVEKIMKKFEDVEFDILEKDTLEFYFQLERNGFVVSGKTMKECQDKDVRFSYDLLKRNDNYISSKTSSIIPDKNTQDFLENYFNGKPQLTSLHIELTSLCNERCIHCYIPHDFKISYINPDLFYNVLNQCKEMNVLHLTLSGGEPMMHKNFCDFIRKCNEYEFSVNILTNLTLVTDEIIREMKQNPLLGVQVSLYSMEPQIHDEITQLKGSFVKTKNAILKLIDNNIPLQISCPIMKQNRNSFDTVQKWAKEYNIHVGEDYGIIARYNHTTNNLKCRLSLNEIKELIYSKVENDSNYFEQIEIEMEKKKNSSSSDFICSICHSSICIADNGNVFPCAGWQDYVVGSIKETSLENLWYDSEEIRSLRGILKKDFPICLHCPDKEFCTMCMVKNANENSNGDPFVVNEFFCNIANLHKQIYLERNS